MAYMNFLYGHSFFLIPSPPFLFAGLAHFPLCVVKCREKEDCATNIQNLLENLIAGVICTALCAFLKRVYVRIKAAEDDMGKPRKPSPAKAVRKQFFYSLFSLVFSLPTAFMLPITRALTPLGVLRILLLFIAGYAFLFAWGAFDAAFVFYPKDDIGSEKPPE